MKLFSLYRRFRLKDWIYTVLILGLTFLQVYFTMAMSDSIKDATASILAQNSGDIWRNCLIMGAYAFGSTVCQIAIAIFASAITASFGTRLREELYQKVSSFSLTEINSFSTASLITRSTNDIQQIQMSTLMMMRMVFSAPITAIWAICKISATAAELTWVIVIGVLVIVVALVFLLLVVFPKFEISQKVIDRLNLVTRESVNGVRVVRAYNAEDYQQDKFGKANNDLTKLNLFTSRALGIISPVMTIVLDGVTVGIYWIGSSLLGKAVDGAEASTTYASITQFSTLAVQVIMAFMMLLMMFIILPRAMISGRRLSEVLTKESSIKDIENAVELDGKTRGTIEFNDVGFHYPNSDGYIFKNVSFKLEQGQTLAIIGSTGSGKTTLINLMARLYDASEGSIKIDGVDIQSIKQSSLRNHIGFVPQKGLLFSGTVASNIGFGLSENDEEINAIFSGADLNENQKKVKEIIEKSAKVSCADEFIDQLPTRYLSPIAQGGSNVSGGQRQRLCIARACAIDPEIFIFDDSFSALDFKTDLKLRNNLKNAFPKASKVIVAQRVGTIMDADLILVIEDGKIVGKGTHKELLQNCPSYKAIALSQLSKEELGL